MVLTMLRRRFLMLFLLVVAPLPALAQDAAEGRAVFNRCRACHEAESETQKVGPHLVGVFGRKAGSLPGYSYSKAMLEAGAAGLVWDDANLAAYLRAPREFLKGNRMAFVGIKDEEDLANLIAWLKADPKP